MGPRLENAAIDCLYTNCTPVVTLLVGLRDAWEVRIMISVRSLVVPDLYLFDIQSLHLDGDEAIGGCNLLYCKLAELHFGIYGRVIDRHQGV